MAITDQTATNRPPTVLFHKFDIKADTVDDLNNWAIRHFTPMYSTDNPAFKEDRNGGLKYNSGTDFNTISIPDGWFIVLGSLGDVSVHAPDDFNTNFVEVSE